MVSSEFRAFAESLKENPMPRELHAMREAYEGMAQVFPAPRTASVTAAALGGRPAEWYDPESGRTKNAHILYLHGGGYAIGSLNTHRHLGVEIARLTQCSTVALDYRLGPENRFPAAVDDAVAAYRQLLSENPDASIAFAGDSAGGGLVVAALVAAKNAGLPVPACAYCMSPWVDLGVGGDSVALKAAVDPLASADLLKQMAQRYLGDVDPREPLASPILADLHGLPPLFIQVGSAEVLLDDAIRLARVAGGADVAVRLEIWPDMVHVWPFFFPAFPEAREALAAACSFLKCHLSNSPYPPAA